MCPWKHFPEEQQHGLRDCDRPDCTVEVPPLNAFALSRPPNTREDAGKPQKNDNREQGKVRSAVDLFQYPPSAHGSDHQTGEIQKGEIE
jgi:hypothetical protein